MLLLPLTGPGGLGISAHIQSGIPSVRRCIVGGFGANAFDPAAVIAGPNSIDGTLHAPPASVRAVPVYGLRSNSNDFFSALEGRLAPAST